MIRYSNKRARVLFMIYHFTYLIFWIVKRSVCNMKDFWKRKRNKRIAASALAVVMAGFLVWGLFPWQAAAAKNTVADDVTINN